MQILRLPLFLPQYYWRTLLLAFCGGFLAAEISQDAVAVMLCTLACAFFFSGYEHRRWMHVPLHFRMGDVLFRLSLVFSLTFWFALRMAA